MSHWTAQWGWPLPGTTISNGTTYSPWIKTQGCKAVEYSISAPAATGGATNPTLIATIESTDDQHALDPGYTVTQLNTVITFTTITASAATGETKVATVYDATPAKIGAFERIKLVAAADSGTEVWIPTINGICR